MKNLEVGLIVVFDSKGVTMENWVPDGVTLNQHKKVSKLCENGSEGRAHSCGEMVSFPQHTLSVTLM